MSTRQPRSPTTGERDHSLITASIDHQLQIQPLTVTIDTVVTRVLCDHSLKQETGPVLLLIAY